ncbi:hypothetical protein VNI00_017560 [Paramarasmius palmivorus]|uniref:Uncharacterized protein n=1 Tax=Paramarasmius palmivorus TaxID=297713 RepID=A0AAW0B6J2_9AGAR
MSYASGSPPISQVPSPAGMPDEGVETTSPTFPEGSVAEASQGLDLRLSPGPDENDTSLDPEVRRWLRLLRVVLSLTTEQTDVVVELLDLVAAEGIRGLGPLLVAVESFAPLGKHETEDVDGEPVLEGTSRLQRWQVLRSGGSITWKCESCGRSNTDTIVYFSVEGMLYTRFARTACYGLSRTVPASVFSVVLFERAFSRGFIPHSLIRSLSRSMSSDRVENMTALARMGDPFTLNLVKQILLVPVPGTADDPWTVVSRCTEVVAALECFTVYLHPYPFGQLHQYSNLPGMDGEQTWSTLLRWFRALHLWSGTFVGSRTLPRALSTSCWVDKMLNSIFDLVYVFLQHYPSSPIGRIVRSSADFRRICIQFLYGALFVSDSSLAPVVAVVVHPFWKGHCFERARVRPILEGIFAVQPRLGYLRVALGRFVRILQEESVLDNSAELHALAFVIVQMHEYMEVSLCCFDAARWFSRCMRAVLALLGGVDTLSTSLLVALELDVLGRLLSLCLRVVCPVVALQEGSGWVLDALKAGLLQAVMDIPAYVSVEKARARHTCTVDHSSSLLIKCNELLVSLVPHLLTPSILRLVRKQMRKLDTRRLDRVLEGWEAWCEEVAVRVFAFVLLDRAKAIVSLLHNWLQMYRFPQPILDCAAVVIV